MNLARVAAHAALSLGLLSGCGAVFPRYTTATRPPPPGFLDANRLSPPPESVRRITFLSATLPPQRADGRGWDDDGAPDMYVVLYRNGVEIFRSHVAQDQTRAVWRDAAETVYVPPSARMRVEVWDDDGAFRDPVGQAEFSGVPLGAQGGGEHLIRLEGGAQLVIRVEPPPPRLGLGVTYEVHADHLRVVEVEAVSPASTAGLRAGDRIIAIDGQRVDALGEPGARQAMDRGALRELALRVVRGDSAPEEMIVRVDAVYPAR